MVFAGVEDGLRSGNVTGGIAVQDFSSARM